MREGFEIALPIECARVLRACTGTTSVHGNTEIPPETNACYKGQIDLCIKGQKFPRVTHGKELCKPYLELLMGRIYANEVSRGLAGSPILQYT